MISKLRLLFVKILKKYIMGKDMRKSIIWNAVVVYSEKLKFEKEKLIFQQTKFDNIRYFNHSSHEDPNVLFSIIRFFLILI